MRVLLLFLTAACGRIDFDATDAIFVSTTVDRLAGPATITSEDEVTAPDLSLREAITIANNRQGPDLVLFSADTFPAGSPATITIDSPLEIGDGTVVDARGRGVIISVASTFDEPAFHVTGTASGLAGLEIRGGTQVRVLLDGATESRVDAVRFTTSGSSALRATNSRQVVFADVEIEKPEGIGIEIGSCTGLKIKNAKITRPTAEAIFAADSTDLEIAGATITLDKTAVSPGISLLAVERSSVHDNLVDPGPVQLIRLDKSSGNEIVGNILDRGNVGLTIFGESFSNLIFRNVIIASSDEAMFIESTAQGNRIINTTIFNSPGIANDATTTQIENTLESSNASEFADPALYNFKLAPTSAAIDAGTDVDTALDYFPGGPERFLGAKPDLGAVESR